MPRLKSDPLITGSAKSMVVDLSDNFSRLRAAYLGRKSMDDNQFREWKQTHKRLITSLSNSLKLEVPKEMMVAFEDHTPSPATIVTLSPQNLGSYGSRLRQRSLGPSINPPRPPSGINRPPSLRDRLRSRGMR